ncbi:MAG: hypothetical protein ACI8RA_002419, partial [Chlamydiales bacterium]
MAKTKPTLHLQGYDVRIFLQKVSTIIPSILQEGYS